MDENDIIVVTGLPRSGTSLMMQILQSIGIRIFTDNQRRPDTSNPKGYFEHELVKTIENDSSWITDAKGKAIKIVSPLLIYLPKDYNYKVIFMNRDFNELILSQEKMLTISAMRNSKNDIENLKHIFDKDINQAKNWTKENPKCKFVEISFAKLIENPKSEITKINEFLEINADLKDAIKIIDKSLYRSRIV